MKPLTIQSKVFLVTLLPLALTAALLSGFFIWGKIRDIDADLDEKGQSVANLLSPASEYGVLAGNQTTLAKLINAAARDPDVTAIYITGARGRILAYTGPGEPGEIERVFSAGDARYKSFVAPIFYTSLKVDDYESDPLPPADTDPAPDLIGHVRVIVSRAQALQAQREVLSNGLLIAAIALLLTGYFAVLISRSVTAPISRLTAVVDTIRTGRLHKRVTVDAGGEVGRLQQGINAMAASLEAARERERERANDELFVEKVKAQTALQSLGEGVITTDAAGLITYLNPAAERLTGWTLASALQQPLREVFTVISSKTGARIDYPIHDCVHNGNTIHHDFLLTLLREDEQEFIIQDTATPIRDHRDEIIGMVLVFHDFSKLHRMSERLAYQAAHDDLTGLLNRREFEAQLANALLEVADSEHALCYIDLDQFKIVNDTCGHQAGDELLRQITAQISKQIRKHDVFARLGGDEFGIILKDCPPQVAEKLANNIKDAVGALRFNWEQHSFEIGASIGLVPISDAHATTNDLLMTADSACYVAKDNGRNRVHVYQPTDADILRHSGDLQWLQTLNRCLENDRFVLYSQLIEPVSSARPASRHYEILIRIQDPDKGLVPPELFIPAAERYQLMPAVDKWVLAHTLQTLKNADLRNAPGAAGFSINLSAQSLTDPSFLDYATTQFAASGLDPALFTFEITETAAIANLNRAVEVIHALKGLGCGFALDDFGSGLSSFKYLSNLPVDYIKIDGYFVRDIANSPVSRSIVESMAHIGRVMGLKTIAECVEDSRILEEAKRCGIDFVQGYGIETPRPLQELVTHFGRTGTV